MNKNTMIRRSLILFFALSSITWGRPLGQTKDFQILDLQPTVLFPNRTPLKQVAKLQLFNGTGGDVHCRISLNLGGKELDGNMTVDVPKGVSSDEVLIPDISSPSGLEVTVTDDANGNVLAAWRGTWTPQRHWKVYIIKSSHEDMGYENYIFNKQHDIANYIDLARRLSGPASDVSAYHYTMETLLFMRNYIAERSEAAWRDVVNNDVKTGRMSLMGAPVSVYTHWMDYEELVRSTYPGRRRVRDRYGLDLKTYMIVDNPSLTWAGCEALADAGFRYVARWGQSWRSGGNNDYATTKLPALFWWLAPDGKSKVLFAWRSHYGMPFWYGQDDAYDSFTQTAVPHVSAQLEAIQDGKTLGPYPYDAVIDPDYADHLIPSFDLRALKAWNTAFSYPQIRIGNPTDFFQYIERKYGKSLPTLSGDLNDFSADYAAIDPESQGWKRRAARLLPTAEGMGTVVSSLNPAYQYHARLIRRAYSLLTRFDEHSWPTAPAPTNVQIFNAQWIKRRAARQALRYAGEALGYSFQSLLKLISRNDGTMVVVFNPLAHERTDLVSIRFDHDVNIIGPFSGQVVPSQQIPGGRRIFIAKGVPAFGYKVYRTRPGAKGSSSANLLKSGPTYLENQYYKITFDPQTGAVRSILDKQLGQELVDSAASAEFNQMIYFHTKGKLSPEGTKHSPRAAHLIPGRPGSVRVEFTSQMDDAATGAAIKQRVVLYNGLKRIDVVDELRHVKVFCSDPSERYRNNIFYAFPFKVSNFGIHVEYPGGVVRPYYDQLPWGSFDFLYADRWADASNSNYGITMAPWEAGTLEFGEIRYNRFSNHYKPAKPYLYSYALSNRMAGLFTVNGANCGATLHYSFTSHKGDWETGGATRFGWKIASPLEARVVTGAKKGVLPATEAAFLKVSAPNVELVTLKKSEQPGRGWVFRLVETEGKATHVTVTLPYFPLAGAKECDLVENDLRPLPTEGHTVRLSIGKYSYATVRIFADDGALPQVNALRATALSDKSVRLTWNVSPGARVEYNIYRSTDPEDPPTAYTLVGKSTASEFVDGWLKIGTRYYYRLAAVSAHNNQGPVSAQVEVRTQDRNMSPPAPVRGLGVVRQKNNLIVYWKKSPEPDVASYYVYRCANQECAMNQSDLLAVVRQQPYFLQTYSDHAVRDGQTYMYKVVAEDWAGNRQTVSASARGTLSPH